MADTVGKLIGKIQREGEAMSKALARPAKPDRLAVLTAEALVFVISQGRYRHLLPPNVLPMQLEYLKGVVDPERLRRRCSSRFWRSLVERMEAKAFPGLLAQIVLRKRKIEELARNAYGHGIRQFVHLNAGYDTLLSRIASEYSDAMCIEVDLPSTQAPKVAVLKRRPVNLHFVDLSLREPYLAKVMTANPAYNRRARTFFICDGVFPFLDEDDIENIFAFMADHSAQHSRFVFTFLERTHEGRPTYPEAGFVTDAILRLTGIRFEWGLRYEQAGQFLNDRFFGLLEIHTARDLRDHAPPPIPAAKRNARSEILAYAELVHKE